MLVDHSREGRQERLNPQALHSFDLGATAAELLEQAKADESGRADTLLVRTPEVRVVLQTLREGAGLAEHHAPGPITVQVLQGELRFSAEDQVVYLRGRLPARGRAPGPTGRAAARRGSGPGYCLPPHDRAYQTLLILGGSKRLSSYDPAHPRWLRRLRTFSARPLPRLRPG
jgi:hypothetical protein